MKSLFEIKQMIDKIKSVSRINPFACVEIQALAWAYDKIETDGLSIGEYKIRERVEILEEKQTKRHLGKWSFTTRPARAKQITPLKWVLDEGDLKG